MNFLSHKYSIVMAFGAAAVTTALLLVTFFVFEPAVMIAADFDTDTFTVSQTILGELAFVTIANDVVMSPSLSGLSSGISQGTTTVAVRANNVTGYNMTIQFSSSTAMNQNGGNSYISNYTPVTPGTPDLAFAIPTGTAEFAYTVFPTDAGDSVELFEVNTGACNNGPGTATLGSCWYNIPNATNTVEIIDRGTPTPSTGATTTIAFRVGVDANPSPTLASGVYTATATLTATEN